MQAALFGGSFDPPHRGHEAIVQWLLREKKIDQVWVIPCLNHPFQKSLHSFKDRFAMCRMVFSKMGEKVFLSEIEKELGGVSYTARTLRELRNQYPSFSWSIVVGADAYAERHQWKEVDALEKEADWVVIPRGKDSKIPDVSGTQIRQNQLEGKPWENWVLPEVADYFKRLASSPRHSK